MSEPHRFNPPSNEEVCGLLPLVDASPKRTNFAQEMDQPPVDHQRGIGLATVTYTHNGHIEESRRFHFQDDRIIPAAMVASMNRHQEAEGRECICLLPETYPTIN